MPKHHFIVRSLLFTSFIASALALPGLLFADEKLPDPSARTVVLTGEAVGKGAQAVVKDDPDAIGGVFVTHTGKYHALARAPLPEEGDPLAVWVHYRNAPLQMKALVEGKWVEFPWNWNKHAGGFTWRKVGEFARGELGEGILFVTPPSTPEDGGIDAIVVTADLDWMPEEGVITNAVVHSRAAPVLPDAANATFPLAVPPPEESAEPGKAAVSILWDRREGKIPPMLYSTNTPFARSAATTSKLQWRALQEYLRPGLVRFHAAGMFRGGWFNPAATDWNYDAVKAALESAQFPEGTAIMINFDNWPEAFDLDKDGRLDPGKTDAYAKLCADLVRFVNVESGFNVRYWEITNEKDFVYWRKPVNGNAPDPAALAKITDAVARAMKAVDPTIKTGGLVACNPLPMEPLLEYARTAGDDMDFFSFHAYASGRNDESDQTIYEKVRLIADASAALIKKLHEARPGKEFEVHLNEYNICYTWNVPEPRMRNHKGAVWDSLALIAFAQVPGLAATNVWNDMDGGVYGKMDPEGNLRPGAHVLHYFNAWLHGERVAVSSSNPSVVAFATVDAAKRHRAFVLVNRSNGERAVTLDAGSFPDGEWASASISENGLKKSDVASLSPTLTLPRHSVTFFCQPFSS